MPIKQGITGNNTRVNKGETGNNTRVNKGEQGITGNMRINQEV